MYKIVFKELINRHEMTELVKMFMPVSDFELVMADAAGREIDASGEAGAEEAEATAAARTADTVITVPDNLKDKYAQARYVYDKLSEYLEKKLDWGVLTGVRPAKLCGEIMAAGNNEAQTREILKEGYYISEKKINLLLQVRKVQDEAMGRVDADSAGIYIGIPFCPTRCLYCSFTSNTADEKKISAYMDKLYMEIDYTAARMKETGLRPESIYVGGGTPTTLSAPDMGRFLNRIVDAFDLSGLREFTVEAGRPDTITAEKVKEIKKAGADRISINPQTMKAETLDAIGRKHSPEDILRAFEIVKAEGISVINADLIAGLPNEQPEEFLAGLQTILDLDPGNITVHTLAVKRASRLAEVDSSYHYKYGQAVRQMLDLGSELLDKGGYRPYYMYRQKNMSGNFENVGYAKPGMESIYNIKIMEENQTIIALGAGGISKVWYPAENRLERVPNVSNYEIYMERVDEMLMRKEKGIFAEREENR